MTGATDVEIADLEELLAGKGWAWLMARFDGQYGPAAMVATMRSIAKDQGLAAEKTERVAHLLKVQEALEDFVAQPKREIQRRRESLQASRTDEFAGVRHRGGTL
jgi:hypothetical protein